MRRGSWIAVLATAAAGAMLVAQSVPITPSHAKRLKNPVPYTKQSIARGTVLFTQNCSGCHGEDGKTAGAFAATATDLTSPKLYKNGATEGEIFHSIHDGAGTQMPPFRYQGWTDQDMWHLVNFIHSLWPAAMRPPLQSHGK